MKSFTCIGRWVNQPLTEPEVNYVKARSIKGAIKAAEKAARTCAGDMVTKEDPFMNLYIFAGHQEIISSWAG